MRVPRVPCSITTAIRLVLALMLVVGSALLFSSTDKPALTKNDKAFYADANTINFVRPGLNLKIETASVADDGTLKVRFMLTDPKGLPLDKDGVTTPGAVSTRFVIGTIPSGQKQYISYLTRQVTSSISGQSATQATSDSGGTFEKVADGEYVYTFKGKAPAGFDKHATHSVGMWVGRDLSEFDLSSVKNYDSDVYTWVPDGSAVVTTRDVIRTQSCEKCHTAPFTAHDERHGVELCVICHQPQTTDPDTGNTVDMKVFIHKIHMGSQLPSVKAGKPYQVIGYQNAVNDWSTVVFPADVRNCTFCHEQNTGAAQANAYLAPSRAACGSCHDNVNFATGENHVNLPQISDNGCASCHIPQGELEFDASILGAHTIPERSASLPGLVYSISQVVNAGPGKSPSVQFAVKDKSGKAVDISKINRLALVLSGPTTDYGWNISEDARKAQTPGDGTYTYTFTGTLPADAKGTYTVGIEGYNNVTLLPGTTLAQTVRDAGLNVTLDFSVDGSPVQARRQVVDLAKCNNCHSFLSLHGGNRNTIQQCVLCHNPAGTDNVFRKPTDGPANSIEFAHMIHKIHTGENIVGDYTIVGYGGSKINFNDVRFPGDRRECDICHVNSSQELPLAAGLQNVTDPIGLLNPMGPATAACTGCHTETAAASHALSNTTDRLGEACEVCHASDAQFGVSKVHAR